MLELKLTRRNNNDETQTKKFKIEIIIIMLKKGVKFHKEMKKLRKELNYKI